MAATVDPLRERVADLEQKLAAAEEHSAFLTKSLAKAETAKLHGMAREQKLERQLKQLRNEESALRSRLRDVEAYVGPMLPQSEPRQEPRQPPGHPHPPTISARGEAALAAAADGRSLAPRLPLITQSPRAIAMGSGVGASGEGSGMCDTALPVKAGVARARERRDPRDPTEHRKRHGPVVSDELTGGALQTEALQTLHTLQVRMLSDEVAQLKASLAQAQQPLWPPSPAAPKDNARSTHNKAATGASAAASPDAGPSPTEVNSRNMNVRRMQRSHKA
jgi:hypothetical protein